MSEERITYDEFMTMFKFAPKMCYTLYDKAEDEIDRLNNIIDELEKVIQENKFWIYNDVLETRENFEVIDIEYILDKLKSLKENK